MLLAGTVSHLSSQKWCPQLREPQDPLEMRWHQCQDVAVTRSCWVRANVVCAALIGKLQACRHDCNVCVDIHVRVLNIYVRWVIRMYCADTP